MNEHNAGNIAGDPVLIRATVHWDSEGLVGVMIADSHLSCPIVLRRENVINAEEATKCIADALIADRGEGWPQDYIDHLARVAVLALMAHGSAHIIQDSQGTA